MFICVFVIDFFHIFMFAIYVKKAKNLIYYKILYNILLISINSINILILYSSNKLFSKNLILPKIYFLQIQLNFLKL